MYIFNQENFPSNPGVYLMKEARGKIIYVGKAKNLRRRLSSYFGNIEQSPKTMVLVEKIAKIDILQTNTEKEALLLESSLIKKHHPKYNIVLRDDKQYCMFALDMSEEFPRLNIVRYAKSHTKIQYYGPYTSAFSARKTAIVIQRIFKLRNCHDNNFKNRVRACLQYDIGHCSAPCVGHISSQKYKLDVKKLAIFLSGETHSLLKNLRNEMNDAANKTNFEYAAVVRDQILAVQKTLETQGMIFPKYGNADIFSIHQYSTGIAIVVLYIRQDKLIDHKTFLFDNLINNIDEDKNLLESFLSQYYKQYQFVPPKIKVSIPINFSLLNSVLCDLTLQKINISLLRTNQEKQLFLFAKRNIQLSITQEKNYEEMAISLAKKLQISTPIFKIECVDISHLYGKYPYAGKVFFENMQPRKDLYRAYRLPNVEGSYDDYLALKTFMILRLESGVPLPDLLLIDGGKGQLSAICNILKELGKENILPVISIAKGASRRAGELEDIIFRPGQKNNISSFKPGSKELLYLQKLRDAAHRFVISKMRKTSRIHNISSQLESLPGIGSKTAQILWENFKTSEAILNASVYELEQLSNIGAKKALQLFKIIQTLKK